ncbi:MAG TPA: hypothetical protein VGD62_06310 [Acidobacteriaceae bacterium]
MVPGLAAKKSRRKIIAPTLESTGPATELGELVALSLTVHLILLAFASVAAVGAGILRAQAPLFYLHAADGLDLAAWDAGHRAEAILLAAGYLCLSLVVGYLLGILSGWLQLSHPFLHFIEANPRLTSGLRGLNIFSLLEERPLSFELFTGESVSRGTDLIFFLEVQLREDRGFITGELVKYALVRDEEPHRPVILRDAQFKATADKAYHPMEGERILIDLADALLVQVSYREREQALADVEDGAAASEP